MKLFEFTKYFFDMLPEEGNYLLFFISILKIGKTSNSYFQIHSSETDSLQGHFLKPLIKTKLKLIDYHLNQIIFREGTIRIERETSSVSLATPLYKIDLNYNSAHADSGISNPLVIKTSGNNSLTWYPIQLKASVNGTINAGGKTNTYENAGGYIDLLNTSILPVHLHILKLLWGRLHNEMVDFTYSIIIYKSFKADSLLILYHKGKKIEFTGVEYHTDNEKINRELKINYPDKLTLHAKNYAGSLTIEIFDHREIILNEFMNPGNQYNKAFFHAMKRISRNPRGIKFLATANIIMDDKTARSEFTGLQMVNEFVSFGS